MFYAKSASKDKRIEKLLLKPMTLVNKLASPEIDLERKEKVLLPILYASAVFLTA